MTRCDNFCAYLRKIISSGFALELLAESVYFDTGPDCVNHVMIKCLGVDAGSSPFAKSAQGEFLAKAARNSGEGR